MAKHKNTSQKIRNEVKSASHGAPATIKYLGEPDKAITASGDIVRRVEAFYEPTMGKFIGVVHYDTHFIYQNPDTMINGESIVQRVPRPIKQGAIYLCTCGAIAGVASGENVPENYRGKLACQYDLNTGFNGKHQTSQINRKDFGGRVGGIYSMKQ